MNKAFVLYDKSFAFAKRIVKLSQYLNNDKKEFTLSKQVLRSGTSIGALVREAEFAQSKLDFIHKLAIALKEANETEYWLLLLLETDILEKPLSDSLILDCKELIALLDSTINTTKNNLKKDKSI
jgi:four helix bundle protein